MTTTDTNVQNPTASSPQVTAVGTPVTDEFDLGITQEDSPVSASAVLPLDQEKGEKEVKSEWADLSFDLPETYPESPQSVVSQEASKPSDFAATEQLNPVLEIPSAPLGSEAAQEATFSQEAIEESVEAQDSSVMKTEEQQMPEFTLEDAQQMQGEPIVESFDTPSVSEDSGVMKVTEQELAAMNTSDALPQYSSAEIASEESFQESSTMELLQEPELVSQEASETIPYSKNEAAVFTESSTPIAFSTTPWWMPEQSSEATDHLVSETQTPFPKTEFSAQEAVSSSVEFSSENPVGDSPEQESSSSDGAAPLDNEAFFSTSEPVALEGTQSSETTLQTPVQETEDIASSSEVKEEVLLPVNQVSAMAPIQEPAAPANGNLLNLDEMISQFSGATTSSSDLDPFQAMKVTLEAQQDVPSEQTSAVATLPPSPISSTITALPEQQLVQEAVSLSPETMSTAQNLDPQQQLPSEKEGVSLGAITAMNPLTAPATQTVLTGSGAQTKNFIKFAFAGLAVLAIGVIMVIRYPDLFSGTTPAPAPVGENTEEPHGAAPELPLTGDKQELSLQSSNEDLVWESDLIDIPDTPEEEEVSGDIQTIDLVNTSETDINSVEELSGAWSTQLTEMNTQLPEQNDALGAVEGLVGPINNADLLKQEVSSYQKKGQELREAGTAQNKRVMIKYGLAVEKEAQKVLDELANGGNIDISKWSELKSQLDDYLAKASNA